MNNDDMTSGDHGHDDHGHADAAHSPEPLPDVDAAALHATVDDIAAALHEYVVTATGVRAEFGAHEADEDPRILSVESRVSTLNATFYDLVHGRLGIHSDLTGMTWDDEAHDDAGDDEAHDDELETFHLGFVVGPPVGTTDLSMDSVLGIVDASGEEIAQRLIDSGFEVSEWGTSRGIPVLFDEHDDGGDE
ncbi:hypothetical protein [Sanguibacter antarcticus]|uniref:Uncharacterized protein n=1 Tax=Sanguibacter antarcticus TaxID=372484 RepID=A0A2A9E646_9MICO|nr:hypothetical protein [Sanguibacter antarcticus]PFG33702.1 hypothetical protein ATL42_1589 [Sanguibacter antarcticus]